MTLTVAVCASAWAQPARAAEVAQAAEANVRFDEVATLEEILGEIADPLSQIERQIQARELDASERWLHSHIDEIERTSHQFDPRLIRPLTLLGDSYSARGEHGQALEQYQRALHLSRVNDGLRSSSQVEIVYREAETFKALGDFQQANDREEYAFHVLSRVHSGLDEELLPGIYRLADWYQRTANIFTARSLYEHAVEIVDANDKLDTPAAIPALQGIATSYRLERFPVFYQAELGPQQSITSSRGLQPSVTVNNFPAGEAALQRIIVIQQSRRNFDPVIVAEAVLDLADWYTLFDKSQRAEPLYAHAWELMAGVDGFDVVGYFADPELLYFPSPGNPSAPSPESRGEGSTGHVEVSFEVTDDGYVRSLDTVGSQPEGLMDFRVRKSLRIARFRPMLVDGVPVAKPEHSYRYEFPYFPERPPENQTNPSTAAADS